MLSSGPRAQVAHLGSAGQTCRGAVSRSPTRMATCQTLSRWLHALCSFQLSLSFTPADLLKWLILALLTSLPFSRTTLHGTQTIKEGLIGKSKPWEQSRKSEHCREPEVEGAFSSDIFFAMNVHCSLKQKYHCGGLQWNSAFRCCLFFDRGRAKIHADRSR